MASGSGVVVFFAQRIELPVIYTRILLIPLVKSTIIKKNGGKYKLGKTTDMFTLKDIIRAVA
jgi:DNA-binding IscR family transcriptional regulator